MNVTEYRSKRFLIVDSYKGFCETLKQMLQSRGANRFDIAYNSKDAIKWCKSVDFDVILMGYDLGEGKQNGQQALEELRTNNYLSRSCIFILITGEMSQDMVLSAIEHKPDAYLTKPFTPKDLIVRLESAYKKKMGMASIYRALDQKKHKDAITLCNKHIENNGPYSNECLGIISRQLFELKHYDQALAIYEKKESDPKCQWAAVGIGKIQLARKEFLEAKNTFEKIITKTPLYLAAYDWLAKVHEELVEHDQAELVLEAAVSISPRSLRRNKQLAQLCEENQNFEDASSAYKNIIRLAKNSVHNKADNRLSYARTMTEQAAQTEDKQQAAKLQSEAFSQLETVQKEFRSPYVTIEANLASISLHTQQGNSRAADDALQAAELIWDNFEGEIPEELKLEFAKSYQQTNKSHKAEAILEQLVINNCDNEEILNKIDRIVENPVSAKGKQAAQKAIKVGIGHYNNHDYHASIKEFASAIRMYPKHVGIKLNLVQALLMNYAKDKTQLDDLLRCKKHLNQLSYLEEGHEHYQRFSKLKAKVDATSS